MNDAKRERYLRNRRQRIAELAELRGITIERQGAGWRLLGPGVDIACLDLAKLSEGDLDPPAVLRFS